MTPPYLPGFERMRHTLRHFISRDPMYPTKVRMNEHGAKAMKTTNVDRSTDVVKPAERPLRILYANVIEQHAGWGAEWFVNRGLERLGHKTQCIDYRQHRQMLAAKIAEATEYDVFFLQRGDGFPIDLVRSLHAPRVFWPSELLARCHDQDPLLASGLFQHVFFHSECCRQEAQKKGWLDGATSSVLLNGFDEAVHKPDPQAAKSIDVLFAGSLTPRRREWLAKLERQFRITVASAYGDELVRLMNQSKIVLNIHAEEWPDVETRVFETVGCGAFLLSERLSSENPFTGEHLVEYDSPDEACQLVERFLKSDDERQGIAARGHTEAVARHTYTHRAREIVQAMRATLDRSDVPAAPQSTKDFTWSAREQHADAHNKIVTWKSQETISIDYRDLVAAI